MESSHLSFLAKIEMQRLIIFLLLISMSACFEKDKKPEPGLPDKPRSVLKSTASADNGKTRVIHIYVALCDNKYQGIVPVPAAIGNGQDPKSNLYWGAGYGVKSFFLRSKDWVLVSSGKDTVHNILERLLFRHRSKDVYLLAEAYDGRFIRQATIEFLTAASGDGKIIVNDGDKKIYFGGASDLVGYIGHDGLMDFSLQQIFERKNDKRRDLVILACYSRHYFSNHIKQTGAFPLVLTTGLMSPEAYTLHDVVHAWVENTPREKTLSVAARAYAKYQKCSLKAAGKLFVNGQ